MVELGRVLHPFIATGCLLFAASAFAATPPDHGGHQHGTATSDAADAAAPPLEIVMPGEGDVIGTQVAVVIETPADLQALTMSASRIGVHLHVGIGEVSLMPTREQLIDLGRNRYLFLFDLPAKPGNHRIEVNWADARHRVIPSSVRSVSVIVRP